MEIGPLRFPIRPSVRPHETTQLRTLLDDAKISFYALSHGHEKRLLLSSCPSGRLSSCISAAPSGRIFEKFNLEDVYGNLFENP